MDETYTHMEFPDFAEWSVAGIALTKQDILDRNLWKKPFCIISLPLHPTAWNNLTDPTETRVLIVSFLQITSLNQDKKYGPLRFISLPTSTVEEIETTWLQNVRQEWEFDYPSLKHKDINYIPKILSLLSEA